MAENRVPIPEEWLNGVSGGALNAHLDDGAAYGTCSSTLTGQTYTFKAADLYAVCTIVVSAGSEADKLKKLAQYWV